MKKLNIWITVIALLLCLVGCGGTQVEEQDGGYTFTYNSCKIAMNADAAPVVEALGEPQTYTEETSCAFEGLDKTYCYGSFYLSTYPLEGKDYVYSVWFVDDSVATEEGVRIGNTQAEVEAAYGADCFGGANVCNLTKGETRLTIILTDGVVSSIQYEAVVL